MSYQVLSVVIIVVLAFVGIMVLGLGNELTIDASVANALILCIATLVPLLPVASLAWVEPDALVDD